MSIIVDVNGHKYTTASQEMSTRKLKAEFKEKLQRTLHDAFLAREHGQPLTIDLEPLGDVIDQAYFMGREDG